eukprot:Cvel_7819.t1-p1 / transcript=Cvel_7819.t1 / gene=Cvel_7819 / organism=Chromera_velia_CCMP2878 / gene_product=hypothetical protein / transcript_product=hypothetical protein / location=Cvel_scaffold417:54395-54634(-) / protein_length=80 / sequence_SO=supercontig / SO=protein_coding / is_pseudo=false
MPCYSKEETSAIMVLSKRDPVRVSFLKSVLENTDTSWVKEHCRDVFLRIYKSLKPSTPLEGSSSFSSSSVSAAPVAGPSG